jgi:hypothetical protein
MQINGKGLLISLPASEVGGFWPSGSLYELAELRGARISDDLKAALAVAEQHCKKLKLTLRLVARPEIFTHGAALEWLRERTVGIEDHLCISDGTAVRPIPLMRNHLFLYHYGSAEHAGAFRRLTGWLPEVLGAMHSQVNTCLSVRLDKRSVALPAVVLQAARLRRDRATYHRYQYRDSVDDSAKESLRSRALLGGQKSRQLHAVYVPLTQSAALSPEFVRVMAALIRRIRTDARLVIVVGLPGLRVASTPQERMALAVEALRLAGVKAARGASERIVFATQDPDLGSLNAFGSYDLLAPESLSFWKQPRKYYEGFGKIQIVSLGRSSREQQGLSQMLAEVFGRAPELINAAVAS